MRLIGLMSIVMATLAPLPALAYSCALSPAKDAVIIKTDNARDRGVTCTVECMFKAPDGPVKKWNEPGRRWKLTSDRTSGPRSYLRPTLFNRITVSGSGSSRRGLSSVRLYA